MDRMFLLQLADDRVRDAEALPGAKRWSAAYYLSGYAVECGLKACALVYIMKNVDVIFRERKYSDSCWTHDIEALVKLADLKTERDVAASANSRLGVNNWQIVKDWSEITRYQRKTKLEAEKLHQAVTDAANGVLPWIKTHW